jgi:hypothetical protein
MAVPRRARQVRSHAQACVRKERDVDIADRPFAKCDALAPERLENIRSRMIRSKQEAVVVEPLAFKETT